MNFTCNVSSHLIYRTVHVSTSIIATFTYLPFTYPPSEDESKDSITRPPYSVYVLCSSVFFLYTSNKVSCRLDNINLKLESAELFFFPLCCPATAQLSTVLNAFKHFFSMHVICQTYSPLARLFKAWKLEVQKSSCL